MKNKSIIFLLTFILSNLGYGAIINNFNANLTISDNGKLLVRETIDVTSDGQQIKRGIYRDIPTRNKDHSGRLFEIGFQLISVKKDGANTPYVMIPESNGYRIQIGDKDRLLIPGKYRYQISYTVDRAIHFFDEHDELYWNVTGNGWNFPIEHASAEIQLPMSATIKKVVAYTGEKGEQGDSYRSKRLSVNSSLISTTKPLEPNQGLTIVVAWPKGIIIPNYTNNDVSNITQHHSNLFFLAMILVLVSFYYYLCWRSLSKEKIQNNVVSSGNLPENLSPQALVFIKTMQYEKKLFALAIINMAVKKFLRIRQRKKKFSLTNHMNYALEKISSNLDMLTDAEKTLANHLFESSNQFEINPSQHKKLSRAEEAFKNALKREFQQHYFVTHTKLFVVGGLLSFIGFIVYLLSHGFSGVQSLVTIAALSYLGMDFLFRKKIREIYRERKYIFLTGLILSIILALISWSDISEDVTGCFMVSLLAMLNAIFFHLLRQPTALGRKIIAESDDFIQYLEKPQSKHVKFSSSQEDIASLYEKYLPFALAFDLAGAWSNQFSHELQSNRYQPDWLHGPWSEIDIGKFFENMYSSLLESIDRSGNEPESNSGFFSGGTGSGDGGGGGGGW